MRFFKISTKSFQRFWYYFKRYKIISISAELEAGLWGKKDKTVSIVILNETITRAVWKEIKQ